jgi:hypothetical protein
MTDKPRQLSRVAGVPRLKLPIWKAAAAQFFQGKKDPSRDEQRNSGKKTKVALLRELAASDPKVKSWLIQFATDLRARDARQMAAEQGFVMPETLGFVPLFPGDRPDLTVLARTVICMEQPNAEELLGKIATLYPDGDPPDVVERSAREWAEFTAEMTRRQDTSKIQHGCNTCGFNNGPATRQIGGAHYCAVHDGKRPGSYQPPLDPSPAAYINSDFGKASSQSPRVLALKAYAEAIKEGGSLIGNSRQVADFPVGSWVVEEKK